jgi:hypothetical protein
MSTVFGAHGLRSMRTRRAKFFPEDQIQLIAIEACVFHDLADLETKRQCRVVRCQEKVCGRFYPTQSPTRLAKWESQSLGFRRFGQKFV